MRPTPTFCAASVSNYLQGFLYGAPTIAPPFLAAKR